MPTATYTGQASGYSEPVEIGFGRAMVFPAGEPVPVTEEVAAILRPRNDFKVDEEAAPAAGARPEPAQKRGR